MRAGTLARALAAAVLGAATVVVSTGAGTLTPAAAGSHPKDVSGTIALNGTPVPVKLKGAGTNGHFTFSATTGQRVSVVVTGSTVGPACPALLVSLVRPNGTTLGTPASTCASTAFLDTQTLDAPGTWTILLDPQGNDVGSLTLQAYAVTDATAPIARNGKAIPVAITTPGQNARFTFGSTAGQQISVALSASTFAGACGAVTMALIRPDGSRFGTSAATCGTSGFLDSQTLDVTGDWTLIVDPQGPLTGTAAVQAFNTNDQTGIVHLGGTAFTVSTPSPGQNAAVHFSGESGQEISVVLSSSTYIGCAAVQLSLVRPDGTAFGNTVSSCTTTAFLDAQTLDQTGMWAVEVDPQGMSTGTASLQTYDATDDTATTDLSGKPTVVKISAPGQNGTVTFAGTTGQPVSAYLTGSTLLPCDVAISLVRPDGTTLANPADACASADFLETQTLDQTGTWTALVDPQGVGTGTATLQVFAVTDTLMKIKPRQPLKTFTSVIPGTNARYQFAGKPGDARTVTLTGSTYSGSCPSVDVSFVRPDGSVLQTGTTCTKQLTLAVTLDAGGTWTLFIDPQGAAMGTMIIRLT